MAECDCRRPVTPDGIYHESTCALRLTERDRDLAAERDELRTEVERLRDGLADLADLHHRTTGGSRKHDPENQSWRDCSCGSCARAADLLDGVETGPDRAWRTVERAEAEVARLRAQWDALTSDAAMEAAGREVYCGPTSPDRYIRRAAMQRVIRAAMQAAQATTEEE